MELPSYHDIASRLPSSGDLASAAEAHGTLCGLLCAASADLPGSWIENTLTDASLDGAPGDAAARDALAALHQATVAALSDGQMSFTPLLPDDDVELTARTEALGRWCQGFLYGLATRGLKDLPQLPDEIREVLEDFAAIAQVGHESDGGDDEEEESEVAYVELVEFVRVGAQLVVDELMLGGRDDGASTH